MFYPLNYKDLLHNKCTQWHYPTALGAIIANVMGKGDFMTTEQRLKKVERMVAENHEILRGMRRRERWRNVFQIFYWLVIIAIALGAYYFIQPYIDAMIVAYNDLTDSINKVREVGEAIPKIPEFDLGSFFGGGE